MSQKAIKKRTSESIKQALRGPMKPVFDNTKIKISKQDKKSLPQKSFPLSKFIALPEGLRPKTSQVSQDGSTSPRKSTPVKALAIPPGGTSSSSSRASQYIVLEPEGCTAGQPSDLITSTDSGAYVQHSNIVTHKNNGVSVIVNSDSSRSSRRDSRRDVQPEATSTPRSDRRPSPQLPWTHDSGQSSPRGSIYSVDSDASNSSRKRRYQKRSTSAPPDNRNRQLQDTDVVIQRWSENDEIAGLRPNITYSTVNDGLTVKSQNWTSARIGQGGDFRTVYRSNSISSGRSVDSVYSHNTFTTGSTSSELEFTDVCNLNSTNPNSIHYHNGSVKSLDFARGDKYRLGASSQIDSSDDLDDCSDVVYGVNGSLNSGAVQPQGLTRSWSDFNLGNKKMGDVRHMSLGRSYASNGTPRTGLVIYQPGSKEPMLINDAHNMSGNYGHEFYTVGKKQGALMQSKMRFSSMPTLFDSKGDKKLLKILKRQEKEEKKRREKEEKKRAKEEKKRIKLEKKLKIKTLPRNFAYQHTNGHVLRPGIEHVYRRPMLSMTAVPIDIEDNVSQRSGPAPKMAPPPPPGPSDRTMSMYASAPDLLRIEQVYGATLRGMPKEYARPYSHHVAHVQQRDYAPRTVVLQRAPEGYGFVLRGAKSQLKPSGELDFQPTAEFPALQYLDSVDPASVADQAGLKAGDFILEINGENVVRASHDRVVHLIRGTGDTLAMKVVTVRQGSRTPDWFVNQNKSMTLPNKKKKAAPVPPQRDPRTSLSMSRSEGQSMSEELAAMETLDKAIAERRSSEEKTASIRSRTATKRVSCVELDGVDGGGRLERASSTPNLLDKAKKDIIYATPTVPSKGYPSEPSSPTGVTIRPKGPPPPPPQEQTSPRKQAPGPPITVKAEINSSPSEVVVINTKKHSPYATPVMQNKSEDKSHYRSSFRPDEPDNASATLRREQHRTPSPVKHASDSGASSPRDHAEKQNVSFAEDKVYDHAASFLKKHPNARLMITADGAEKARNRNSRLYEPEPDYEIDSGEDSPRNPQSPKPAVTVISIGEKKPAPKPQTQQYTVHSTIPSESSTQNFPIPPRPAGPAPTPPTQKAVAPKAPPSPAPPLPKFSPDHDEIPPPVESFPPPPPPITNSAPPPPPPPPSQVPPPPPPPPSQVEVVKIATTDSLPTITPIPSDIIAAAVQKRQERIAKEGLNIGPPASKPVISVKDSNQAAILAAVAKRREHLDTIGQESVVASIESRLQKTKKLQAAKFSLAGSKTAKKDGDNGVSQGQPFNSSQVSPVTKEIEKKVQASRDTPVKEVNTSSAKELSFTVKTPTSKPSTKIPPKPTNETNVSAKVNRQESLKLKPEPLANAPVTQKTASTETKKEEKTGEIVNGQSDFLALAEKRRQEYLQRKQKSPPGSKTSTPGTSTVGTPEKDKFRSNKIVINSFEKKSTSPPVSAKPKTNGTTKGYTELQSPQGLVKVKPLTSVNGTQKMNERNLGVAPPPPPGFRDDRSVDNTVVQLEIIPPPPSFSSDSGTDMNVQHSPGFSPDTASLVSSLSTLSSLSGDHNDGRSNGYEDLIAPPPPGFDDGVDSFIPPPPEFGSDIGRKTASDFDDKPVEQWLCKDVLDWLDSLKMSQYKESFQTNCIDGKKLLALTRNNYIELGVSQVGHRMNIERSIKKAAAVKQNNNLHDIIASEHL